MEIKFYRNGSIVGHTNHMYIDGVEIEEGTKVKVISGEKMFEGVIEKTEWDFDQWSYFIDGEWYCQSEINIL